MDASVPSVPTSFEPPIGLVTAAFTLEPLGPRHNESGYAAWSSSIAHIQATPGFPWSSWPHEMSLAENLAISSRTSATSRTGPGSPTPLAIRRVAT